MNTPTNLSVKFIFIAAIFFTSCSNFHKNASHENTPDESIDAGKRLAGIYCNSCHQLPDPSLLDTKTWENGVLPAMGQRLGISYHGFKQYPIVLNAKSPHQISGSPNAVLNLDEWQHIIDYYVATSPDSLPGQKRDNPIKNGLQLFKVEIPSKTYIHAATCFVKINSDDTSRPIVISDEIRQNIYFFNTALEISDSAVKTGPVVDIAFDKSGMLACDIGVFNPNNGKFGKGKFFKKKPDGTFQRDTTLSIDTLQRPVQITAADLNGDGRTDYLICEFGYLNGALSWMENLGGNRFKRHILRNIAGAIKAYIADYNHDGLPDIWALFAQGEEGIFLFTNKGNGNFTDEEVLRFPPSYGSSYFEFADFNKDGYPDIVYTCGDNGDFSQVLKPYHGVYIFMNDKTNHFSQKFFFPINGCYKAIARDYDGDGDLDIAVISFFADYARQPEEGFVYLENRGNFDFTPYSFTGANLGRWLTMDAGDFDGDGKTDIILGNFSIAPSVVKHKVDWKQSPPFIILKNIGK